jgi:diguanylate cyclase (GGDEF)-like protein
MGCLEGLIMIRILLVDDDDIILNFVERALAGFEQPVSVRSAETLLEAKKALEEEMFDCALIDYRLPDGEGTSLVKCLTEREPVSIPTILMTAQGSEQIAVKSLEEGATGYLPKKDLTPEVLFFAIQNAIRIHQTRRALSERTRQLIQSNQNLEHANVALERLTRLDPLTEVLNRRGFQDILTRECRYTQREGQYFIVLLVDLDDFKRVNDLVGHEAGDLVLKEVARRLSEKLRATDYVARVGGDEFMILLPKTRPAEGVDVAQKIRRTIAEPIPYRTGDLFVTASIGLAMVKQSIQSIDELLAKTHLSLVKSKGLGKDRISFDPDETEERTPEEDSIIRSVNALCEGHGLSVVQESISEIDSLRVVGYEISTRSQIAGMELPDDFFQLAAEVNALSVVDRICFEKCVEVTKELDAGLQCHINLHPSTLLSAPIPELLKSLPRERPRGSYCIQLSEKRFVGNALDLIKAIREVRSEGVLVAIDDVGFGHTFLESLILLQPDCIRIDRHCVLGVGRNKLKRRVMEQMLKIVGTFRCDVIVKGVDSKEDLAVLRELGVRFGQGTLLREGLLH